jgi:hypothetical protein
MARQIFLVVVSCWLLALTVAGAEQAGTPAPAAGRAPRPPRPVVHKTLFVTSDNCFACHNSLTTSGGE